MRQVYYGWYVVAIATVVYAAIVGSTYSAFGVFVHPVSEELKLTRADMNTAMILMNVGMATLAPFIGRLLDRFSPKRIMTVAALVFIAALVGLGLSRSVALSSVILLVLVPIAYLGGCSLTLTVLLARWFNALRGRAMTLAGIGMSLGSVIVTPMIGYLVETQGWRSALVITGVAIGSLVAVMGLIVRDQPGPDDIEVRSAVAAETPSGAQQPPPAHKTLAVGEILSMPQFWLLGLATALALGGCQTLGITFIPLALENGSSMLEATGLMSIMGVFAIIGGLGLAVIADKVDRVALLTVLFLVIAGLNGLLLTGKSYAILAVAAAVMGVSAGTVAHLFYALLADRFGTASFGTVRGLMLFLVSVVGMVAVRFGGEVFDRTKNYDLMFLAFMIASAVAAGLMFASRFTRAPSLTARPASSTT